MKIVIITSESFPYGMATSKRTRLYAEGFVENGCECDVYICHHLYKIDKDRGILKYKGIYNNINYYYSPYKLELLSKCFCNRLVNLVLRKSYTVIAYFWIIKSIVLDKEVDVILNYYPSFFLQILVFILCKIRGIICVKELNEIPYYNNKRISRYKRSFFLSFYCFYNIVLCISDSLVQIAQNHCGRNTKIIKIPIITKPFDVDKNDIEVFLDQPYIIHSGSLSEDKDGMIGILKALTRINGRDSNTKIHIFITGNHPHNKDFEIINEFIKIHSIDPYVHFLGYLSPQDLQRCLSGALCAIINKYNTYQNQYCFSTKLCDYLNDCVPVIITKVGEAMNYMDEKNSVLVEPGDIAEMADAVIDLFYNKEKRNMIKINGKRLVAQEFNYLVQTKRIIEAIKSCN